MSVLVAAAIACAALSAWAAAGPSSCAISALIMSSVAAGNAAAASQVFANCQCMTKDANDNLCCGVCKNHCPPASHIHARKTMQEVSAGRFSVFALQGTVTVDS